MRGHTILELILVLAIMSAGMMIFSAWPRNFQSSAEGFEHQVKGIRVCWLSIHDLQRAEQERTLFLRESLHERNVLCE